MKEGDEKFALRDFPGALKAYQGAHAIMRAPTTGLAVAKAQIEQGQLVEARDTLLEVLRRPKEPFEAGALTKARDEATGLAAKILDRIPSLVITLAGPPSDAAAEVTIDGSAIPSETLGSPRKVNPGQHVVAASVAGFQPSTQRVSLREADHAKVVLELKPAGGAGAMVPAGTSRIHVESQEKAGNVFVDGKAVGVTPLDIPVSIGRHKVEIEYAGGSREDRSVDAASGAIVDVKFTPSLMDEVSRPRKGLHWGLSLAPAMTLDLDGGSPSYGGIASFLLNIGIAPMFEFRTGVSAGGMHRGDPYANSTQITAVVPALLGVNYTPWFSFWGGLAGGFMLVKEENLRARTGGIIGPEWSVLTMRAGDRRQYELSFVQGLRFGNLPQEYHQSFSLTYLFLD